MPSRYTKEQKDYVREIAQGRYNQEIADLFNARFDTNVTADQIKGLKANHKIASGVPRRKFSGDEGLFNKQQKEFLKSHAAGITNKALAELVNAKFGLSVTAKQINTWKKNHGVISGLDCRFKKWFAPPNKGQKGMFNVGGNKTSFKKGQAPRNYKPVGSERVNRDGYTLVKVQDDGPWHKRWRHKHKVVWEAAHGPVPKGYVVLFLDQDRSNITLDNLIMLEQSRLSILNKKRLLQNDAEFTKTGIIIADIYHKMSERTRKKSRKVTP